MINEALKYILSEQEKSAAVTKEDYMGTDGLLYCAKCHTPKQQRLDEKVWLQLCKVNPDFPRITYMICDCQLMEEEKRKEAEHVAQIEQARERCFPEKQLRTWRFQADSGIGDRDAMEKARIYADRFAQALENNIGLTLWGEVGTGKSFLAACVANSVIEQGYSCLMTSFSRITDGAWSVQDKETYFDSFSEYDLLVIDDLGVERKTGYVDEIVTKIIERRCNSGKPVIMTTNIAPATMMDSKDITEKRVYSRLFSMTRLIQVRGNDLREMVNAEKIKKSMEIFGF